MAFVFGLGVVIARGILDSLTGITHLLEAFANGDLRQPDADSVSGLGELGEALNQALNAVAGTVHRIARASDHVASASEQISFSAAEQAQTTDRQKDQTAQIATAMQQMSSTVLQVSANSAKAAEASRRAAHVAHAGDNMVEDALAKMRAIAGSVSSTAKKLQELSKSSDKIGRIIGVIDDIADQTNLLALNAAIEAAHAAEHGREFAVVAEEVRKLAERSARATKEIAEMILTVQEETAIAVVAMEEGTRQVEEGVSSTSKAGDALKQIIQASEQVGEMITQIAAAVTEQSSATEQINRNMEGIAGLLKESAGGAREAAKACEDLSELALDLQKLVSKFRVDEDLAGDASTPGGNERGLDREKPRLVRRRLDKVTRARAACWQATASAHTAKSRRSRNRALPAEYQSAPARQTLSRLHALSLADRGHSFQPTRGFRRSRKFLLH